MSGPPAWPRFVFGSRLPRFALLPALPATTAFAQDDGPIFDWPGTVEVSRNGVAPATGTVSIELNEGEGARYYLRLSEQPDPHGGRDGGPAADLEREAGDGAAGSASDLGGDAVAQGYREDNPAGEAIGAALPRNGVRPRHHPALPYAKVGGAIETSREPAEASCSSFFHPSPGGAAVLSWQRRGSNRGGAQLTEQITVSVDPEVAEIYRSASDEVRRKLEVLVNLRLRDATLSRRPLRDVMREVSRNAQRRGLTPEILQSILDEA